MAEMPEIGTLSNKTISKSRTVSLANDSANIRANARCESRAAIRDILFIVGSVVARYEPDFSPSSSAARRRQTTQSRPAAVAHKYLGASTPKPARFASRTYPN
jgi:transposase